MRTTEPEQTTPALQQAFEAFNESAQRLSAAYAELEQKFQTVNQELASTNEKLRENLQDKQRLQHYLMSILDSMHVGVVTFDLDGCITLFNRGAAEITGVEAANVLGQRSESVFGQETYYHPEPSSAQDVVPEWLPTGPGVSLDLRTELVQDGDGQLLGVLLLFEDVSEKKRLQEQVRRTNTLAALGKMAAEIVHEIRNPLAAMQIYARILQQDLEGDDRQLADDIMAGIQSLELISGNMLSLTRSVEPRFGSINLAEVLESSLEFSIYAVEEHGIELVRDYPMEGLHCEGDFQQLKQVALNLVLNAVQAMPQGGRLEVRAHQADSQALVWQIRDNGMGIPAEHRDRIFTPFFSSKPSGTGLGLHTVERILQAHQASIDVVSEVDQGTEFTICLPTRQN